MWSASQRLIAYERAGQSVVIFHLGDHDPSGIDMSRDIEDRLTGFGVKTLDFQRLALNMPQVRQYNPPPNPAKVTDSRFDSYRIKHGDESWELDALDPKTIIALITKAIASARDMRRWRERVREEKEQQGELSLVANRWDDVVKNAVDEDRE